VDIEEHLAQHRKDVRALARKWTYNNDDADEAEQIIMVVMWERHESGAYEHHWPDPYRPGEYVSLLGYVKPYLRGIALEQIIREEYRYGITEDLDKLQEIAEEQGRNRLHLDPLYESPIPGLKTPLEGTLWARDQELVEKLKANLTDEELLILDVSYNVSDDKACAFLKEAYGLNMGKTTYWRKRQRARAKAQRLAQGL
jgi:hypothetical protein